MNAWHQAVAIASGGYAIKSFSSNQDSHRSKVGNLPRLMYRRVREHTSRAALWDSFAAWA